MAGKQPVATTSPWYSRSPTRRRELRMLRSTTADHSLPVTQAPGGAEGIAGQESLGALLDEGSLLGDDL